MHGLFHRLLDKLERLVAGLTGEIVASWWYKYDLKDLWCRASYLISGIACALYLIGIVCDRFAATEPSDIAFMAMDMGATAVQAVEIAAKRDTSTAGKIRALRIASTR